MATYKSIVIGALLAVSSVADAAERVVVYPVQIGQETVRYRQGVGTLDLWTDSGAVQITPLPMTHGSLAFSVSVLNGGDRPINFGVENIRAEVGARPVGIFTRHDLERRAENRALWRQIGMGLLGGFAAAAAASQRNTFRATTFSPYGSITTIGSYPSVAGQLQSYAISRDTAFGIAAIQYRLDETRERLANEIVQLSTVDPGQGYAGTFVLNRVRGSSYPYNVRVSIELNGNTYPFEFLLGRRGTSAPAFNAITPAAPSAAMLARFAPPAQQEAPKPGPALTIASQGPQAQSGTGLLRQANTTSGFCINAGADYRGTGSRSRPAVTSAMPRCDTVTN